ncbi:MAG: hypothetical protein PHR28_09180 [candidate division Zixibacteria bacterium]|nr:hypothetical protein [candidate division Zixibacteria bacterium]
MSDMIAWNVYVPNDKRELDGPVIIKMDTVYYDRSIDAREVRRSLIQHDGYPDCIEVTRQHITFSRN